jgi:deoxyribonuclease V
MMPMSSAPAIACLDVAYRSTAAAVACVLISSWDAKGANRTQVRRFDSPAEKYEPGAFYKRELPLLLSIISQLHVEIEVIVIDGYVWLDANSQLGLGGHLFSSLGRRIPVIGIAKTRYRDDTWSIPVLRGESQRPLFVTSAGIEPTKAAECVRRMHGDYRIPTILNLVDRAAREGLARHH